MECIFEVRILCVTLAAFILAVSFSATVSNDVIASTGQFTQPNNSTGFRSTLDTYVSSEPGGYGVYEVRHSNVFSSGETFILYVEPAGMAYGPVTEGVEQLYNTKLSADITISDGQGNVLAELTDLPMTNIISHHKNKELFLTLSVEQQSPFPPGDYVINYVVNDDISGESFEITKNVSISG